MDATLFGSEMILRSVYVKALCEPEGVNEGASVPTAIISPVSHIVSHQLFASATTGSISKGRAQSVTCPGRGYTSVQMQKMAGCMGDGDGACLY